MLLLVLPIVAALLLGDDRHAELLDLFGGEPNLALVAAADRVEITRLEPPARRGAIAPADAVRAGPVRLDADQARALGKALIAADSYLWEVAKGCAPSYEVRLTFHLADRRLDIDLCLGCKILVVHRDGREIGGEDFDPIYPLLLRAAQAAFPDDEAIAALK